MNETIKLKKPSGLMDWKKIKRLYMSAFPKCERKPFSIIRYKCGKKASDVWVLEKEEEFLGLAITINGEDLVLLDYFAIEEAKRQKGYGSSALKLLQSKYEDKRLFLEIERTDVQADNLQERIRRKAFYLKNGMLELNVYANLFGVSMELLGHDCQVSFDDYFKLYVNNYGVIARRNISELAKEDV